MEDRMRLSLKRLEYYQNIVPDTYTKRKIEKFEKYTTYFSILSWLVLAASYVFVTMILLNLINEREMFIIDCDDIVLRTTFVILIMCICFNQIGSIRKQEYVVFKGTYSHSDNCESDLSESDKKDRKYTRSIFKMIQIFLRYMGTLFAMFTILFYILTNPKGQYGDDAELYIDKIQNFTSLVIIMELDDIIIGQLVYNFFGPLDCDADEHHIDIVTEKNKENKQNIVNKFSNATAVMVHEDSKKDDIELKNLKKESQAEGGT